VRIARFFSSLYLSNRFFILFGILVVLFAFSFGFPFLFYIAQGALAVAGVLVLVDIMLVFNPRARIVAKRTTPKLLSLGSENNIRIQVYNHYNLPLRLVIIDELPFQLQQRNFSMSFTLGGGEKRQLTYIVRPLQRGEYVFGKINIYLRSSLGIVERRYTEPATLSVPVYPSLIQMKKFELKAFSRISHQNLGIKKIRRIGHSYEFEQIKNYVRGDDYRSINWKATSRKSELMVNQYEDEKAQQIYSVIDKSRAMRMPFDGLSLLDHSINASLVISNIALLKQDKAGLLTFADKIDSTIKAERSRGQLKTLMEALYKQKESVLEANYEMLYYAARNFIKGRSLIFLYSNFESYYAMERVLPILRKINNLHLLVVIFFENTEVSDYSMKECNTVEDVYFQTIAQKFVSEKRQIVNELKQYGIQAILTRPEDLSMNTVNKYLELKSRGMI
jgi:uncharacterized protein (DUF58 family)